MRNPFSAILNFVAKENVEPALLAQIDYLTAENRTLKAQVKQLNLNMQERITLAKLGKRLCEINKAIFEATVQIVNPETILRWHRDFVAKKFDGSANRTPPPHIKRITKEIEAEIVRIAQEDLSAGYGKIVGYLEDLGVSFSKTTIAKILKKHGIKPAPKRKYETTWKDFIARHTNVMWGCDFFTQEVWTLNGLVTYYVLVFIHLGSRKLEIGGVTEHPTAEWTTNRARNFLYDSDTVPEKASMRFLLHDKGSQFNSGFDQIFTGTNEHGQKMKPVTTTCAQMNSHCERVIQSIQNECTDKMVFLGERMLRYALKEYQTHYNTERHHQGIGNVIPFPSDEAPASADGEVKCKTRLGGMLRKYYRKVA